MQISKYLLLSIWFGCLLLLSSAADGDATEIKGPAPALAPGGDNNVFVSEWSELEKDNGGGLGWITTWIIGIGMFCCSFPCLVKNECSAAAIDRTIGAARRAVVKNQPASTTNFHNNGIMNNLFISLSFFFPFIYEIIIFIILYCMCI